MKHLLATGIAVASLSSVAAAAIQLPSIISDNMVLQRSEKTPLWGKANAGEKVTVHFNDITVETVADEKGKWRVDLNLTKAPQTPGELTIAASETVTLHNVVVGEVWLCSGQSNMQWNVALSINPAEEAATANYPLIRQFAVQNKLSNTPLEDAQGQWVVASPQTVGGFTAVGYFFGREIHQKTGQPVGLINSSWGGTDAESWTSDGQLMKSDRYAKSIEMRKMSFESLGDAQSKFETENVEWENKNLPKDETNEGLAKGWAKPETNTADWKTMRLPQTWQNAGLQHNGIIWFRKDVDVPADLAGKPARLELGAIDDADITYVNGEKVGDTFSWNAMRNYELPAGTLKAGRNVIAVRVWDHGGGGGIYNGAMRLVIDGAEPIKIDGDWHYAIERKFTVDLSKLPPRPAAPATNNPNQPAVLYNGMIAPIVPYGIKGAIWYQGENNSGRHAHYRDLLGLMIGGWRKDFGQGDFPFYIVQLANFMARADAPTDTNWAKLREAQSQAASTIPNSGLAVTIDIGDAADIHPKNKQDVGKRLAAIALVKDYGQAGEYSGPVYASHRVEDGKLRVTFKHTTGGLTAKGGELKGFSVAGEDGKFSWANATIDGETIVVQSPNVSTPTAVRYAWADNPECNLYNGQGFPAVPFRSDAAK